MWFTNSISIATKSMFDGIKSKFGVDVSNIIFFASAVCSRSWYEDSLKSFSSSPIPDVAFACGSRSIKRTFFSKIPKHADKFSAVVVLPTPPFWFDTAIILGNLFISKILLWIILK